MVKHAQFRMVFIARLLVLHDRFFAVGENGLDTHIGRRKPTSFIVALLQLVSGDNETKEFILTGCRTGTVNLCAGVLELGVGGLDIAKKPMISGYAATYSRVPESILGPNKRPWQGSYWARKIRQRPGIGNIEKNVLQ
jgi:hypothetical protein